MFPDEGRPLSLLLDLSSTDWWRLQNDLSAAILDSDTSLRIKSGLVLAPLPNRPAAISMGPYDEQSGRRISQTQRASLPLYEERLLMRLLSEISILHAEIDQLGARDVQRAECYSISLVTPALAARLIEITRACGALIAAVTWTESDAVAGDLLWTGLILREIVVGQALITDYEEFPDKIDYSGDAVRWTPDRKPDGNAVGFFYNDIDGPHVEADLLHLSLPPDIQAVPLTLPPQTPLQRALRAVGNGPVLRISGHDQREVPATFKLPFIHFQYPDLLATERKVRSYCLNAAHPDRKWIGFREHGYGTQPQDAIVLASELVGALLGKFKPKEAVATSNGELQFSVGVAIPSVSRHRALLNTAWIAEPGMGFRLTTAYLNHDLAEYADAMPLFGPIGSIQDAWDGILERANREAARWNSDGAWARPRIFIPRSGATRELARGLAVQGAGHGTFKRAALGGRALLVPVGPNMSWSQAAFVAAFVQVQLGLRGVRSLTDVWVD